MTVAEYVEWAKTTRQFPADRQREYLELGLLGELGEVAQLLKRKIRDGREYSRQELLDELGDVAWYLFQRSPLASVRTLWGVESWTDGELLASVLEDRMAAGCAFLHFAMRHGYTLDEVLAANVAKIEGRIERGTVRGSGDGR